MCDGKTYLTDAADREWANWIRDSLFVIGFAGSKFDSEVVMVGTESVVSRIVPWSAFAVLIIQKS
ncbi:MAG TPA: hypothetical protein VFC95_00505 [Guyparkeria sp.]|nr:hypothetical protein [Guyparkeria sp.]